MLLRLSFGCALTASAFAQTSSAQFDLANMREDIRGLVQRVGELSLRVEQLERENSDLRRKSTEGSRSAATVAQLNEAVVDLNRSIKSAVANSQNETLQIVSAQLEKLGQQTNAALESLSRSQSVRPIATAPLPAVERAKESATYTVQKGDSLASIAKKTGAKPQDIVAANKISDPSLIKVGQTLIIPGSK